MEIKSLEIDGLFEILPIKFKDDRGVFVKEYHKDIYITEGLEFDLAEQYFSISQKNVIRGMHFQIPPYDHTKIVYCIYGAILDVLLDLRKTSPTYGKCTSVVLNSDLFNAVYIPKGFAHGFCSLIENSTMVYNVSTIYNPDSDCGLRFDSFGFKWPVESPIINTRDSSFIDLEDFVSPF